MLHRKVQHFLCAVRCSAVRARTGSFLSTKKISQTIQQPQWLRSEPLGLL